MFPIWERCYSLQLVRVIASASLVRFVDSLGRRPGKNAVRTALAAWFYEVRHAQWRHPMEVKASYRTASIVSGDRVVFNIKGNDYRLVTAIDYRRQIVFIKWIGSHKDYDKIDAKTIRYGD